MMEHKQQPSQVKQGLPFPAAYSVLSMDALRERILVHYTLGKPVTCRLLVHGFHDHYLVMTPKEKYVLRVYQAARGGGFSTRNFSDILYEVDFLLHLKQKGLAVSFPIAKNDGTFLHSLQAPEGTRYAVLFAYVEGKELSPAQIDEAASFLYGSAVARLHEAAADFSSAHSRLRLDLTWLIDEALHVLQPVLEARREDWAYLLQVAQFVKAQVELFAHQGLEVGACHGDAQGGNASINSEQQIAFFDFEACGSGWRAYELAVFYWAAAMGKSRVGKSDEEVEQLWAAYLKGYLEQRPLAALDTRAIPLFVIVRHFWFLGINTANWDYWGWERIDGVFFDRELAFLRMWITQKIGPI